MSYVRPEIAAMQGYVPGEQPPPGPFIKLNTNENPYPPSPRAIAAIQAALTAGLQTYPDPLATSFRNKAADLLGIAPDWILCGNGSDELLTMAIRTLVGPGQTMCYPAPSYSLYRTLAEIQGARVREVAYAADWSLPNLRVPEDDSPRLVIVANPNSPSGTCVPRETVRQWARDCPCPLLVDEAYVDFADDDCLSLVREFDKVLVTRSLSKSYALAGLRFGYVVGAPDLLQQMMKVKDSYNCDRLAIAGATAAITDLEWLRQAKTRILATRQRMRGQLMELGFQVPVSQANFLWCTRSDRPVQPLYAALKDQRILVRYMHYPNWGDGLRISVGTDEQVDTCLDRLRTLLNENHTCHA